MKKTLSIICSIFLVFTTIFAQKLIICNNDDEFCSAVDSIIKSDSGYIDSTNYNFRFYLQIKVDSLGEIHSCHVLYDAGNVRKTYYNALCLTIENEIRVPFLYQNYKDNEYFRCYLLKYRCFAYPLRRKQEIK